MPIVANTTTEANLTVPIKRRIYGSHSGGTEGTKTATEKWTYQVAWDDRWEFIRQVNGLFPTSPQRLPMQDPYLPGILVSSTNYSKGLGVGTGCDSPYKYAFIDVTFKTPEYETSGDNAWLRIDRDTGGQFITCPAGVYSFGDGTKSDTGIGEFVPLVTYGITRFKMQAFDDSVFHPYIGKLNSSAIFGCAIGTLRFDGVQSTSSVDIGGVVLTDVTYAFTWRPINWNWAKHPRTGEWGLLSPIIHNSTSLGDLFA